MFDIVIFAPFGAGQDHDIAYCRDAGAIPATSSPTSGIFRRKTPRRPTRLKPSSVNTPIAKSPSLV